MTKGVQVNLLCEVELRTKRISLSPILAIVVKFISNNRGPDQNWWWNRVWSHAPRSFDELAQRNPLKFYESFLVMCALLFGDASAIAFLESVHPHIWCLKSCKTLLLLTRLHFNSNSSLMVFARTWMTLLSSSAWWPCYFLGAYRILRDFLMFWPNIGIRFFQRRSIVSFMPTVSTNSRIEMPLAAISMTRFRCSWTVNDRHLPGILKNNNVNLWRNDFWKTQFILRNAG